MSIRVRPAPLYYDERAAEACTTSPLTRMRRVCASRAAHSGHDTDDELVARMVEAEAIVTQMTALQAADLAELRRRRVSAQTADASSPAADPDGWVVPEVAVALGLTDNQVHQRLGTAAFGRGNVWPLLDELATYVTADRLQYVEQSTVSWLLATLRTVTQLTARMRRLIAKAKADAGHDTDERTIAARQADVLVAAVTYAPALPGHDADVPGEAPSGRVVTRLSVAIPIHSLLPAGTATRWWADGASPITWREQIPTVPGYAHPRLMDEFIRSRDRTCRAPGCRRSAAVCDCDRHEPYPTGATSISNGCCLCRRHHRLKTHGPGWRVDGAPDTYLTWRAPSGVVAQTQPHDFRTDDERECDVPPF